MKYFLYLLLLNVSIGGLFTLEDWWRLIPYTGLASWAAWTWHKAEANKTSEG